MKNDTKVRDRFNGEPSILLRLGGHGRPPRIFVDAPDLLTARRLEVIARGILAGVKDVLTSESAR